ncbi:MAG: rhomboid family intramembrane serine protease [Bacteroidia bacterium]|nr:rhomboid family intramembrane serine protease [Bacteroidia bacterium]
MLQSIIDDVRREFRTGNMVTRLIIVNVVVFIIINVLKLVFRLTNAGKIPEVYFDIRNFFCVSTSWLHDITHPWVFITSNFLHEGFFHIFWNMLLFFWFGRIVGDLIGDRKILPLYLLGGIFGCLAFFVGMNLPILGSGVETYALGASASVMAVIVAAAVISPDYTLHLLFLGPVKMKYIAIVLVLIDVFALSPGSGGPIGHLGGAAFGAIFVGQMRAGRDMSVPVNRFFDRLSGFVGKVKDSGQHNSRKKKIQVEEEFTHQERVDAILDKIKAKGYESLTKEEKEFLFHASKK